MKLALLKGNRFNPWHLEAFTRLPGNPSITAFRAESDIQRAFAQRSTAPFPFEARRIHFDTQKGHPLSRLTRVFMERYGGRTPRIAPFHTALRDFDVVQSWELFTDWSAQAARAKTEFGVPLAVMVWDNIPFNMEREGWRRGNKRRVAAAADVLIVHTERSRRMLLLEGVTDDRIVKLDPGVDLTLFSPGPADRHALGLDNDALVLLFVGWLLPRKGIDVLLFALRDLVERSARTRDRLRLLVVGSEPGGDRVEQLVTRLGLDGLVKFAGPVPHERMPQVYRAADMFVLPSVPTAEWQEQFGMALIEAMASGLPAIASATGGIPEMLGNAGILCQAGDFLALSEALESLATNGALRQELGIKARARAEGQFNVEDYAAALGRVYEDLARKKG